MSNPKIMAAFDYIIVIYSEDGIKNITPYLPMWLNINLTTLVVAPKKRCWLFCGLINERVMLIRSL
jgi:hypothetical protein